MLSVSLSFCISPDRACSSCKRLRAHRKSHVGHYTGGVFGTCVRQPYGSDRSAFGSPPAHTTSTNGTYTVVRWCSQLLHIAFAVHLLYEQCLQRLVTTWAAGLFQGKAREAAHQEQPRSSFPCYMERLQAVSKHPCLRLAVSDPLYQWPALFLLIM